MRKPVTKRPPKSKLLALVRPEFSRIRSLSLNRKSDLAELKSYVPVAYEKQFLAELTPQMTPYLKRWVTTGNCSHLVDLLRLQPITMFTHFMGLQIIHLRNLVGSYSMEEAEEEYMEFGASRPTSQALPYGVKPAAIEALRQLLGTWADEMLPGAVVLPPKPKAKPAHRPCKWDHLDVLLEYNDFREQLDVIDEECVSGLVRKRGESEGQFLSRMTLITQQLHLGTTYSMQPHRANKIIHRSKQMPSRTARTITKLAISRKGLGKNLLIYSLMAHYREREVTATRRAVEWARKLYPEHNRTIRSTP